MKSKKKIHIETYGCQMNFSDSEIVMSVLADTYEHTSDIKSADLILINTCSIRDNAEARIWNRLKEIRSLKKRNKSLKIGIIGCMAERLKEQWLEKEAIIDLVVGPDAYRDLPKLLQTVAGGQNAINTILSEEETYADISPIRYNTNGISAFVSIMRGCQNFCSYCVVPYTRGKERSRDPKSILNEAQQLFDEGYREITLLGQNVNSFFWNENDDEVHFWDLMAMVAKINPLLRIRFATSHPKDLSNELIQTIASFPNICKSIHLPVQSGSNNMLKKMNRKYTREWYLGRIAEIKKQIPDCSLSTDIIAGFCDETEQDHQDTLSIMREVGYEAAYMFKYSTRPGTLAHKKFDDNVSEELKIKRLQEIINLQQELSLISNKKDIGKIMEVLIEGFSKRSKEHQFGRNSQNKVVVFPKTDLEKGNYVNVQITECSAATLKGFVVD
ncbi:MAG: tRNA (N6-isopentenyl adenosine(37)-C2)-methylthiotransferase MiaB [Bacteroidales bacterium]|nr:tRNA (N6-isopentenyl adenosine(37)-C2)-methylthiotransferase MiaB [Bacteroidales bacterium]MDY0216094.1 tRNA (N6-isopentenyl adenosine(37)-C2)-methylthiotransferase MiaB [Bacteroidales bacterium]